MVDSPEENLNNLAEVPGAKVTAEESDQAREHIIGLLGPEWLQAQEAREPASRHDLYRLLVLKGGRLDYEICAISRDVKEIEHAEGFPRLLQRLKVERGWRDVLFEIHVAALFARAEQTTAFTLEPEWVGGRDDCADVHVVQDKLSVIVEATSSTDVSAYDLFDRKAEFVASAIVAKLREKDINWVDVRIFSDSVEAFVSENNWDELIEDLVGVWRYGIAYKSSESGTRLMMGPLIRNRLAQDPTRGRFVFHLEGSSDGSLVEHPVWVQKEDGNLRATTFSILHQSSNLHILRAVGLYIGCKTRPVDRGQYIDRLKKKVKKVKDVPIGGPFVIALETSASTNLDAVAAKVRGQIFKGNKARKISGVLLLRRVVATSRRGGKLSLGIADQIRYVKNHSARIPFDPSFQIASATVMVSEFEQKDRPFGIRGLIDFEAEEFESQRDKI